MKEFAVCLKKYFNFKERGTRREFWLFTLFGFIILAVLGTLDYFLATTITYNGFIVGGWLIYFGALLLLFPFSAALTRRLHDTGKPEIWMILMYVTVVGLGFGFINIATAYANTHSVGSLILLLATIFVFFFYMIWLIGTLCVKSQMSDNKYGPCPLLSENNESGESEESEKSEIPEDEGETPTPAEDEDTQTDAPVREETDDSSAPATETEEETVAVEKEEATLSVKDQILAEIDKLEQNIEK